MSAPLFSVVLPSYNRARLLRTALKTVDWQTERDFECFVVDDGSTDGTAEVLARYESRPGFTVLRSGHNQGMNASRNLAIRQARGRFVTFLDSDDLWLPDRLAAFRRRAEEAPDAGFFFSNAWVLRFGRILGTLFDPSRPIPEGRVPGSYAVGDAELPYVTTNVAVARAAFTAHGLFKTEMRTLDTELFARVLAAGIPVAVLRSPLSVRRLHDDQLTDRYEENFRESMLALDSADAAPKERAALRRRTASEVGLYLVKAGRPAEARAFLSRELGTAAPRSQAWPLTTLPAGALKALKAARAALLKAGAHPLLAGPGARAAWELVRPLLAEEES
ncbi:MAG: glycosyltransferase family 2 protein [Elusimicrobia bacterium]|nr:glycosyltransferase family 2 protein [Elusimicrobiota bacterium]